MKTGLLIAMLWGTAILVNAQGVDIHPVRSVKATLGVARHGSGDIKGIIQGFEFEKYFRKRVSWSVEAGSSIHNGRYPQTYIDEKQKEHDISYRYTVAGFQVAGTIGYCLARSKSLNFGIKAGALFRYQSSSAPSSLATYFPAGTNLSFPVMLIENVEPQNTYSPGGVIRLFFNYTPNNKYLFGLNTGFQADTNGDILFPQFAAFVGRSF
ncbi:hypothetical protein [Dyadobacter sp. MSC1_007]|uniref:hypothetical protein n=1 Tax=Dyadobacter sp. MSC1_007 TaxID=2909264 RepID=UPI00202FD383|nr:hypothetical protein [Dyadobacter sp. MSC1_007]